MRIGACILVLAGTAAAFAAGAPGASPRMSPSDRQAIGILVDRFVKDNVLRRNLTAGWSLIGPDLRGGTTRAAWDKGVGVTVPYYPVPGTDFRNAWTGGLVAPGHAELAIVLHPRAGEAGYEETAATIDVRKLGGRWVVDLFYAAAVFHERGVSGPNDFGPGGGGSAYGNSGSRIAGHWLLIGLATVSAIVLSLPFFIWYRSRRIRQRAWAAYRSAHASRDA